jgi:hypothetical protein
VNECGHCGFVCIKRKHNNLVAARTNLWRSSVPDSGVIAPLADLILTGRTSSMVVFVASIAYGKRGRDNSTTAYPA